MTVTPDEIEAQEARELATSYRQWAAYEEAEAARYEARGDLAAAALHRKNAAYEREMEARALARLHRLTGEVA